MQVRSAAIAVFVAALAVPGCGGVRHSVLAPDLPPEVQLTASAISGPDRTSHFWLVQWKGSDADGHVDHYLYAVDPASADPTRWTATMDTWKTLSFRDALPSAANDTVTVRHFHVFEVRAVDDRGQMSQIATMAFFLDNIAPIAKIVNPAPSFLEATQMPVPALISWSGYDPDGTPTRRPVKYKFRLVSGQDPDFPIAIGNPDSLLRRAAPRFATWDSLPGDSTSHVLTGLQPYRQYAFLITAIDQAGDYDPIASLDKNVLWFMATSDTVAGPFLSVAGNSFRGWNPSNRVAGFEWPARTPITISWSGQAAPGRDSSSAIAGSSIQSTRTT